MPKTNTTPPDPAARSIISMMPLAANITDRGLNLLEGNEEALRLFGMRDFSEYKKRFNELSPEYQPDGSLSSEKARRLHEEAITNGHARFEWLHQNLRGEPIPCEITLMSLDTHIIAFLKDTRELHTLYEAEHQQMQAMLDASPILCAIFDEDYRIIDCNQAAVTLLGLPDKRMYLERLFDLCPEYQPGGKSSPEEAHRLISETFKIGHQWTEWMHIAYDTKELIPCEVYLERVALRDKHVVVVHVRDLRQEYKLKELQAAEYRHLQAALDSSPLVVSLYDDNDNLLSISEKVKELMNIDDVQVYLDDPLRFYPEYQPEGVLSVEKSDYYTKKVFETGSERFEWTAISADGELIPTEETLVRVRFGDVYHVLAYTRDLREEKAMTAKLEESIANAQLANQAKTRFLARMSHEIRTPMNSVLGIAELELQKNIHPSETEEAFFRIYTSANLLLTIINDILDLSKVEAGKMEIIPVVYEVASMIIDTVQLNLMYIGSKRIEFKLNVDENLPAYMSGDELRVKQILNNILSNAFKYTTEGEVRLNVSCEKTFKKTDANEVNIAFEISDTGQGMTAEQLENLFTDDFTRFNIENNYAVEGSGLGLNIAYQLITMMGGSISVESEPGRGSAFLVRLPQKTHGQTVLGAESAVSMQNLEETQKSLKRLAKMQREPMPYGRVLVVDDVESNLYVAKGFLIPYRLSVETVDSGKAAIELVKKGNIYDIIFMDHMMPELDGLETTKILRGMGYSHPIIALTANAFSDMADMFMNSGFSGYASKPIDINHLDKYLLRFIRDKQPESAIERARTQVGLAGRTGPGQTSPEQACPERTSPERAITPKLAASFVRDAKKAIEVMSNFDGDIKAYTITAHGIKSGLTNIGRMELAETAGMLEKAGLDGNLQAITDNTNTFLRHLSELADTLNSSPEQNSPGAESPEDKAFLAAQLQLIHNACINYQIDDAKEALQELSKRNFSKQTKALLEEISEHLLVGDFEEAAARLIDEENTL